MKHTNSNMETFVPESPTMASGAELPMSHDVDAQEFAMMLATQVEAFCVPLLGQSFEEHESNIS